MKKYYIILAMLLLMHSIASAHDFVVTINGQRIYFSIVDEEKKTAEVTFNGSWITPQPQSAEGELTIPAKVRHNDKVYSIIGIGSKAFSGADKLTGIILPSSIKAIKDFAFEGCTSLSKVVFPGNKVELGQGIFFKCDKIKNISLGSDWKEINLRLFMWSDSLQVINIPAKINDIKNLKSLRNLKEVTVDINNEKFSSSEGILYDKSGEKLYGVPRAYEGNVKVAEKTKTITPGAFFDCNNICCIDFPENLSEISMKELSRAANLKKVIFRNQAPIMTATNNDKKVFLFQVTNPQLIFSVPKKSVKLYQKALPAAEGDFTDLHNASIPGPYHLTTVEMPQKKSIKGW